MKSRILSLLFVSLCLISFARVVRGQEKPVPASAGTPKPSRVSKTAFVATSGEKIVRAAYAKLTELNKAALFIQMDDAPKQPPKLEQYLRFAVSNVHVGPIGEILDRPGNELLTGGSGPILDVNRSITQLNGGQEHVAYRAEWSTNRYASGYDPTWTMKMRMSFEPHLYYDVGMYAAYDVTLLYEGKTIAYKAVALFHNPYGSVEELKPSFWDSVVGRGGSLTDAWKEQRPLVQPPHAEPGDAPAEPLAAPLEKSSSFAAGFLKEMALSTAGGPRFTSVSDSPMSSSGDPVTNTTEDFTEHTSGRHGQNVTFQGTCTDQSSNQQVCRVNVLSTATFETGAVSNWFYVHVNRIDNKSETATGPRSVPITCTTGRGVATRNCLNPECLFTATLVGAGFNMQMTGGDVWNGQLVHQHTCAGGICMASLLPSKANGEVSSLNSADTTCCTGLERGNCTSGGGEWQEVPCGCISPIVIDLAGNGFDLTRAADGVRFDLGRTGVAEQFSWTAANSDDAWLVLDRNGNGAIDDGKEMFGSATPQPYLGQGESKNGFRALALFDTRGYGGNDDGQIDGRDSVFSLLQLWQDRNHNGISEPQELQPLSASDVRIIELNYRESRRKDENGNWFRYRVKVRDARGADVGRWAWDVFLQKVH